MPRAVPSFATRWRTPSLHDGHCKGTARALQSGACSRTGWSPSRGASPGITAELRPEVVEARVDGVEERHVQPGLEASGLEPRVGGRLRDDVFARYQVNRRADHEPAAVHDAVGVDEQQSRRGLTIASAPCVRRLHRGLGHPGATQRWRPSSHSGEPKKTPGRDGNLQRASRHPKLRPIDTGRTPGSGISRASIDRCTTRHLRPS